MNVLLKDSHLGSRKYAQLVVDLTKSIVRSLPLYYSSIYRAPLKVLRSLNGSVVDFFGVLEAILNAFIGSIGIKFVQVKKRVV